MCIRDRIGIDIEVAAVKVAVGADAFVGKGEPPDRLLRVLSAVILGEDARES